MTSASRGNASGGHVVAGAQIQPGALVYTHLSAALQGSLAGFRNKLINGDFRIWQRGTSLAAGTGNIYLADRWVSNSGGSTVAPSRQAFTVGQTAVPGEPAYFHRSVVASSAGAGNFATLQQRIEGVRTLAGQNAILSFWAKADAARNIALDYQQSFGGGGSPSAVVTGIGSTLKALTTSWQQFKVPVTIPSIAGKTLGTDSGDVLELTFWFDAGSNYAARAANLGQQSGTFDIANVQLEAGADVTPFEQRPIAQEILLCMRYFEKLTISTMQTVDAAGRNVGGTAFFKVLKRASPTVTLARDFTVNAGGTSSSYIFPDGTGVLIYAQSGAGGAVEIRDIASVSAEL